jgi:hypothetical protein
MGRIALPAIVAPPQESGLGHLNGIAAIDDFGAYKIIVHEGALAPKPQGEPDFVQVSVDGSTIRGS